MSDVRIHLDFEGSPLPAQEGDTVASALLRAGVTTFSRGPKYHRPRGPFCLAGTCAQCHMRVDGEPNVPTCETPAADGLSVERQNALGSGDTDLLRAIDFIFRDKLDHHHLMTRFKGLSIATQAIARRLAGIGEKPARPFSIVPAESVSADVVVIGAGRRGLEAARREQGRVLVLESRAEPGGRALDGLRDLPDVTLPAHVSLRTGTRALGLYDEGGARFVLARNDRGLVRITTERVVLATGGIERPLPFEANDLPGVFAGRGLASQVRRTGPLPGKRVVVIAGDPDAVPVARTLASAGHQVSILDPDGLVGKPEGLAVLSGATPLKAHGRSHVSGLFVRQADGHEHKLQCDVIAVVSPLAPAYELAAQVGARARYEASRGGFVLETDGGGRTSVPWIRAVGRVAG